MMAFVSGSRSALVDSGMGHGTTWPSHGRHLLSTRRRVTRRNPEEANHQSTGTSLEQNNRGNRVRLEQTTEGTENGLNKPTEGTENGLEQTTEDTEDTEELQRQTSVLSV